MFKVERHSTVLIYQNTPLKEASYKGHVYTTKPKDKDSLRNLNLPIAKRLFGINYKPLEAQQPIVKNNN